MKKAQKQRTNPLLMVIIIAFSSAFTMGFSGVNPEEAKPSPLSPPGSYKILNGGSSVSFPFEVYRGDIRMKGQINGHDVNLLIDNGVLWDDLLMFGSEDVDALGLNYEGSILVRGSGEGSAIPARIANDLIVGFPGIEFYDQRAQVTSYIKGARNLWAGTEGQVSATFLEHFVVAFNFDTMMVTLTEPKAFTPDKRYTELKMVAADLPNTYAIESHLTMADGRKVSVPLFLDLGNAHPLQISPNGKNNFKLPELPLTASLGFGMSGPVRGHFFEIPSVEFGGFIIPNVLAGFDEGNDFHEIGIGFDLLDRFNLVFDYNGRRLFIHPNSHFNDPSDFLLGGVGVKNTKGTKEIEISRVRPRSTAYKAGARAGDKLISINGRDTRNLTTFEIGPLLDLDKTKTALILKRGTKTLEFSQRFRAPDYQVDSERFNKNQHP